MTQSKKLRREIQKELFNKLINPYKIYTSNELLQEFNKYSAFKVSSAVLSRMISKQRLYALFRRKPFPKKTQFIFIPKEHIK